jgi:hypothetical protein
VMDLRVAEAEAQKNRELPLGRERKQTTAQSHWIAFCFCSCQDLPSSWLLSAHHKLSTNRQPFILLQPPIYLA